MMTTAMIIWTGRGAGIAGVVHFKPCSDERSCLFFHHILGGAILDLRAKGSAQTPRPKECGSRTLNSKLLAGCRGIVWAGTDRQALIPDAWVVTGVWSLLIECRGLSA